jgi:hypothetical protein
MTIGLFLQIVVACSLVLIVWHCHEAINLMTKCTNPLTRAGYLMLAGGAALGAVMVVSGAVPHWPSSPVAAGVALIMSGKRWGHKVSESPRSKHEHRRRTDPFRASVQD